MNDCNFIHTYPCTKPKLSLPTLLLLALGKHANKKCGLSYLKYIFDALIDKFNINGVQKCVRRKDLTPGKTTAWEMYFQNVLRFCKRTDYKYNPKATDYNVS